jgi:hypothetical protein
MNAEYSREFENNSREARKWLSRIGKALRVVGTFCQPAVSTRHESSKSGFVQAHTHKRTNTHKHTPQRVLERIYRRYVVLV